MRFERLTNFLLKHRLLSLLLTVITAIVGTHINQFDANVPLSIVFLAFLMGLILCTFSVVLAAFFTLMQGAMWGAIFMIAATMPYLGTLFLLAKNGVQDGSVIATYIGIGVAVLGNLFTWIFAVMLNQRMNWRQIIQSGALIAVLIISIVYLVMPTIDDWWGAKLQLLQVAVSKINPEAAVGKVDATPNIELGKQFVNGMIAAFVLLSALSQLMLARFWQFKKLHIANGLRHELYNIRLNPLAGILFMASFLFSYLGNSVVLDIMPVLYVVFAIAGLSLVHCLFKQLNTSKAWFWLSIMYVAFFLSGPVSIMLIAMFALFDTWLDVRKRFSKV